MIDDTDRKQAKYIRDMPPSMLDAGLLAEYVSTGTAVDLFELCRKADVSLKQVAQISVSDGLDELDKLPGYAVTADIFELAENLYSIGESRRQWQLVRNQHKPAYLESRQSREAIRQLEQDRRASNRYYANIFFRAWAVFWDDNFLERMIGKLDGQIIASVPEKLNNERTCFAAVSRSGLALRYVPEGLRTLPVCAAAVENNRAAIAFTPAHLRNQVQTLIDTGFV